MWYVLQVFTGDEEKMQTLFHSRIRPPVLEECMLLRYEEMKRYEGKWHKEMRILFPGYLIVVTDQIFRLIEEMRKIDGFKRVLGDMACLLPLSEGEIDFLRRFCGDDQIVEMSVGVIENDRVRITSGPLMGMEGCIRKLDRHKRTARIEIEMFGRQMEATVGLEIVKKI